MTYDINNPFLAKVIYKKRISGTSSGKNVQHIIFDISGSGISYKCGDSVAIYPKNDPKEVEQIVELLGSDKNMTVNVPNTNNQMPLYLALREHLDIRVLTKKFWENFVGLVADKDDESYIENFIINNWKDYNVPSRAYSLLKTLQKFKKLKITNPNDILLNLKKLSPRLYSIASSPLAYPNEVHIVINTVSYVDSSGDKKYGVASGYLSNEIRTNNDFVKLFIIKSQFSMPEDHSANIIMVGPGTGIAPFRGFLQERSKQKRNGEKIGESWLFFGDRNRATDFLFEEELMQAKKDNILSKLDLAFSRDQESKIYVQDKIWKNREELWSWIKNGAYIYICGNASKMAVDVENTLNRIAIVVSKLDEQQSQDFFKNLRKARRFQKDVY